MSHSAGVQRVRTEYKQPPWQMGNEPLLVVRGDFGEGVREHVWHRNSSPRERSTQIRLCAGQRAEESIIEDGAQAAALIFDRPSSL